MAMGKNIKQRKEIMRTTNRNANRKKKSKIIALFFFVTYFVVD